MTLAYSDGYLARLAREHDRLGHLLAATADEIEKRERELVNGLSSRNLTRLDVEGFLIRRVGRSGISIV